MNDIINYLDELFPNPRCELNYNKDYELLIAVMLSAQTTDKRVNMTTPALFERFPDAKSLSDASVEEVYSLIKSISYPNNKAKNLVGMAKALVSIYKGVVPDNVDDLQTLPGVGRKTANVVASVAFNKPAMAVDTHVFRVSARIGLTQNAKNPLETEKQLVRYLPVNIIPKAHHWLILHGRYVCKARKPECEKCGITSICDYFLTKVKNS